MALRKILYLVCLVVTALCLTLGYARIGPGMALAAVLVILGVWSLAYRWPASWFPSIALGTTVCLAVIELWRGASPYLMLAAAALALVNWDLVLMDRLPAGGSGIWKWSLLEKKHYQSLSAALGLALPTVFLGRLLHVQIPFGIMMLLVILAFISLLRAWTMISEGQP